jgi:hypothetical protein
MEKFLLLSVILYTIYSISRNKERVNGGVIVGIGIIEKKYDFTQKPLSPHELLRLIREALGR